MGRNVFDGQDPRVMPAYTIEEAAHYLRMPSSTLRDWVRGRWYHTTSGERWAEPLLHLPEGSGKRPRLLSFINMVEAHALNALRCRHMISLPKVREALKYLEVQFPSEHPLAERHFETDGLDLFMERYGQLINITQDGQVVMREVMSAYLRRVEWDDKGLPLRLYPFISDGSDNIIAATKTVVIDPYIAFGRPVITGTGLVTAIIAERYRAGESIDELATDYGRSRLEIEEVIRCEMPDKAA